MNIIVCCKASIDVRDVSFTREGKVQLSGVSYEPSEYDLLAIDFANELIDEYGGSVKVLSVGGECLEESALRKSILAHRADALYVVSDKRLNDVDTHVTARVIAAALNRMGDYDLLLFGEGSGDFYFQQVGLQVGELLGIPAVNAVSDVRFMGQEQGTARMTRVLETEFNELIVDLPAAVMVEASELRPKVPGLKDKIEAQRKPVIELSLIELDTSPNRTIEVMSLRPSQQGEVEEHRMFPILMMLDLLRSSNAASRSHVVIEGTPEEKVKQLVEIMASKGLLGSVVTNE